MHAEDALMTNTLSIGEALPIEMARVRDHVMPAYIEVGAPGLFALSMMRVYLDRAAKAMAEGDTIEMIRIYEELKGYSV
jgi:hypothetical protein